MGIFGAALSEMEGKDWRDPDVYIDYCKRNQITPKKTAPIISVQSFNTLDPELRQAGVMVLRLGSPEGRARFALVRSKRDLESEFFLRDNYCFQPKSDSKTFLSEAGTHALYPFQLLGSIQEGGAVNLAIASGLLAHALCLDDPRVPVSRAMGASTYSFSVRPMAGMDVTWQHEKGQVEIDTIFLGRRNERWVLFVIEAKHGPPGDGLAKHKLAYPVFVMASKPLPRDIDIVPVYLRSWVESGRVMFGVCECTFGESISREVASLVPKTPAPILTLPLEFITG